MTSKEIKKEALEKLKGKYVFIAIVNLFYGFFAFASSFIIAYFSGKNGIAIIGFILSIIFLILSYPFSYGVVASTLKKVREENVSTTEFINIGLKNIGKAWKVFFSILIKLIVPTILLIIITVLLLGSLAINIGSSLHSNTNNVTSNGLFLIVLFISFIALAIYISVKSLYYVLTSYILYDKNESTGKEIVEESERLMTGERWNFFKLIFSFIGWFLLIAIITGILSFIISSLNIDIIKDNSEMIFNGLNYLGNLALIPYLSVSQIVFYEKLKNSKSEIKE